MPQPDDPADKPTPTPFDTAAMLPDERVLEQLRAATTGEFDIHGELARGGMASVYLAHDIALDRKVAIKVMSPEMMYGPGMVERFRREARTSAALSHPNIIPVYTVREANGLCFFVMKLIQGATLDHVMGRLPSVPIDMVEAVIAQVGTALGYAHRRGVIHRDVKPSNIMIDDEGWAVVADFGIAKVAQTEGLTLTGAVGTPTYMSPEQCLGGEITPASDQYSLGVIAYEMLSGKRPFGGETPFALMYSHINDAPPALETVRPDCPPRLRHVVERMLAKDPALRWPTLEDVVTAVGAPTHRPDDTTRTKLVELARTGPVQQLVARARTPRSPIPVTGAGLRPAPPLLPGSRAATPRRGWLLGAVGGAAAVCLVAITYFVLNRPAPAPTEAAGTGPETVAPIPPPPVEPQPIVPPPVATAPKKPESVPAAIPRETKAATAPLPSATRPPAVVESVAVKAAVPESSAVVTVVPPPAPLRPIVPPPPAPIPAVADPRPEIEAAIHRYAEALESGDLAQVRRAYPGMTSAQQAGLVAFYSAGGSFRTRWTIQDLIVTGDTATARVVGTNRVTAPRSRTTDEAVALRVRLERQGDAWRLVTVGN